MQHAAFGIHLGQFQAAGLRHAQAVAEHQQQKAAVAGLVTSSLGGRNELFDLAGGQVFAVVVHFVQCWGVGEALEAAPRLVWAFEH